MTQLLRKESVESTDIFAEVSQRFSTAFIQRLATISGDSPRAVRSLVEAATASFLAAAASWSGLPQGRGRWKTLIEHPTAYPSLEDIMQAIAFGIGDLEEISLEGRRLCQAVFGGRLQQTLETLARVTGIRLHSVTSLISLIVPVVVGSLRESAATQQLSAESLATVLSTESAAIRKLLPGPLPQLLGVATQELPRRSAPPKKIRNTNDRIRWGWIFVVGGVACVLGWLL